MFIDVIEYVEVPVYDTIVEIETEYVEIFVVDTVIEYVEVINTEYIDCDSGMPCNSGMEEILDKSKIKFVRPALGKSINKLKIILNKTAKRNILNGELLTSKIIK